MDGETLFNRIKNSCVGMIHEGVTKAEISKSIEYNIIKEFDYFIETKKELADKLDKIQHLLDEVYQKLAEK